MPKNNEQPDPHKLDAGKTRWDVMPWAELEEMAEVLTFGMEKYKGTPWDNLHKVKDAKNRYFAALHRHLVAFRKGEVSDPETGLHHLAHAACCLFFLHWLDNQRRLDE